MKSVTTFQCDYCKKIHPSEDLASICEWSHGKNTEERVAEILHSHFCRHNHIDQCGWYYDNWTNCEDRRDDWLSKARNITDFAKNHKVEVRELCKLIQSL